MFATADDDFSKKPASLIIVSETEIDDFEDRFNDEFLKELADELENRLEDGFLKEFEVAVNDRFDVIFKDPYPLLWKLSDNPDELPAIALISLSLILD